MPRRIVAKPEQKLTGVVNQEADRTPRHDVPRAWWCEENIICTQPYSGQYAARLTDVIPREPYL